jgi:hypothetical protein
MEQHELDKLNQTGAPRRKAFGGKAFAVNVPLDLAAEIKRRANDEERSVDSFLRRHLSATLLPEGK